MGAEHGVLGASPPVEPCLQARITGIHSYQFIKNDPLLKAVDELVKDCREQWR